MTAKREPVLLLILRRLGVRYAARTISQREHQTTRQKNLRPGGAQIGVCDLSIKQLNYGAPVLRTLALENVSLTLLLMSCRLDIPATEPAARSHRWLYHAAKSQREFVRPDLGQGPTGRHKFSG